MTNNNLNAIITHLQNGGRAHVLSETRAKIVDTDALVVTVASSGSHIGTRSWLSMSVLDYSGYHYDDGRCLDAITEECILGQYEELLNKLVPVSEVYYELGGNRLSEIDGEFCVSLKSA